MRFDWVENRKIAAGELPTGKDDLKELHRNGIRAILSLTLSPLTRNPEITRQWLAQNDMTTYHFPIVNQQPPDATQVAAAMQFIAKMNAEGRPVYVHCQAGVRRTGTLLHLYYLHQGMTLEEAKEAVQHARPINQFRALTYSQQRFLEQFASESKHQD